MWRPECAPPAKSWLNTLFVVGGDGTLRGALSITKEIAERGLKIAVVGIPKTIDNDIMYIDQSFGFQTAFSMASEAIRSAHAEAISSPNGVGLVKVMGRHSGFIACYAALAKSDANYVLIPEVSFQLDGPQWRFVDVGAGIDRTATIVSVETVSLRSDDKNAARLVRVQKPRPNFYESG